MSKHLESLSSKDRAAELYRFARRHEGEARQAEIHAFQAREQANEVWQKLHEFLETLKGTENYDLARAQIELIRSRYPNQPKNEQLDI